MFIFNMETRLNIHKLINERLDFFHKSSQIPNIIFHGSPGTGKKTLVDDFICKIYEGDKTKIKSNVMMVNCSHGKGIKFIREELKFFARANIQSNAGVKFKTIVLLNADSLTNDAQSALRRCIELFSSTTRFFIVVENKHKLLNPILSRFCEIYVPEYIENGNIINLHQYVLQNKMDFSSLNQTKREWIAEYMEKVDGKTNADASIAIYENGYSCLDVIEYFKGVENLTPLEKSNIVMCFNKIKSEFRCEKLLILYILDFVYNRDNTNLKAISFM
jgi:replication-associated recombination protein RarA